ncbi:MAG: hypothetical protein HQK99_06145 [Nitrospirae bacterium]|nr:hypothetical protein [Nitrospirota bacterium]
MKTEGLMEDYKRALLTTFFIQKRIIYFATAVIFIASVFVSFLWPKTYASYGSIFIKGERAEKNPQAIEKEEVRTREVTKEDLNSEAEILTSSEVIRNAITHMRDDKNYKGRGPSIVSLVLKMLNIKAAEKDKGITDAEVQSIKKRITTEIVPTTNVIKITLTGNDPKYAVSLLDTLMNEFLKYRSQLYNTADTRTFYAQQVNDSKKGLESKEDQLLKLFRESETVVPAKEIENNLFAIRDLEQDLFYLKQTASEKARLVQYIENALKDKEISYFSFIEGNEAISNLSKNLQDFVSEGGPIVTRYTKESEKYRLYNEQVNIMYNALKKEVEGYVSNVKRQLDTINDKIDNNERRLDRIRAQNIKLQDLIVSTDRIKRDLELDKANYDIFSKRNKEALISSSVVGGNLQISIMSKAFPSTGPIFPIPGVLIPVGLIAGALTGMTLGFLKEFMDQTFKSPEDVVKYANLPVLLFIPFMPDPADVTADKGMFPKLKSKLKPDASAGKPGAAAPDSSISDVFFSLKAIYVPAIVLSCLIIIDIGCQVLRSDSSDHKAMTSASVEPVEPDENDVKYEASRARRQPATEEVKSAQVTDNETAVSQETLVSDARPDITDAAEPRETAARPAVTAAAQEPESVIPVRRQAAKPPAAAQAAAPQQVKIEFHLF